MAEIKGCDVEGCDKPARSGKAAYCGTHYRRLQRTGDLGVDKPFRPVNGTNLFCEVEGCERPSESGSSKYCSTHRMRLRRRGDLADKPKGKTKGPNEVCSVEGCDKASRSGSNLYCEMHYRRMERRGDLVDRPMGQPRGSNVVCEVNGCDKPSLSGSSQYCIMHYSRLRRSGTTDDRPLAFRYQGTSRYVSVTVGPDHPLAPPSRPWIYEHRKVLYEAIGPGPHPCHWCGAMVNWMDPIESKIEVDHLNQVRDDNRPENLVASCKSCNAARTRRWLALETAELSDVV